MMTITITQEMLDKLTTLYNENEERNDRYIEKYLSETDATKLHEYNKFAFGCVSKARAMEKVFKVLGLEADLNDDNEFVVKVKES